MDRVILPDSPLSLDGLSDSTHIVTDTRESRLPDGEAESEIGPVFHTNLGPSTVRLAHDELSVHCIRPP